jgi:hypothetical protein
MKETRKIPPRRLVWENVEKSRNSILVQEKLGKVTEIFENIYEVRKKSKICRYS